LAFYFLFYSLDEDSGMRRSELVTLYLKEIESEIETEAQLMERKMLAEKVIYRLVNHVSLLPSRIGNILPPTDSFSSWNSVG
jgi:hypothetical protein